MDERTAVILDGDPGHDDAIAWVLAKSRPELDIRAITTVGGNQTIDKTTYNALRIATLIGYGGPIAKGRAKPLCGEPMVAPSVHGESGLDGPALPEPAMELSELRAVELMAATLAKSAGPITLVPTGPLTNVAALLLAYPELKAKIAHICLMGGGVSHGNWTPAAEFNILVDPEAAQIVFASGLPITMAGLDVTEKALVYPEDFERIRAVGNHVGEVVADWLAFFYGYHRDRGYLGAAVHDAVAVASLVAPQLFCFEDMHVEVDTKGAYTRGETVGNRTLFENVGFGHLPLTGEPANARVITGIDREGFVDLLVEAAASYGEGA